MSYQKHVLPTMIVSVKDRMALVEAQGKSTTDPVHLKSCRVAYSSYKKQLTELESKLEKS